jgi:hypothetical protein
MNGCSEGESCSAGTPLGQSCGGGGVLGICTGECDEFEVLENNIK